MSLAEWDRFFGGVYDRGDPRSFAAKLIDSFQAIRRKLGKEGVLNPYIDIESVRRVVELVVGHIGLVGAGIIFS